MAQRLDARAADFDAQLTAFLEGPRGESEDVAAAVREIIEAVREQGFAALQAYTERFDNLSLTETSLAISEQEIDAAENQCDPNDVEALDFAANRIRDYHVRQIPKDERYTDEQGVGLGWRWTPVDSAGLYAPGGRAAYPSSVLMNAVAAKAAGVPRLAMASPAPNGEMNPLVLAAAKRAGVDEIYRVGGAQSIAALAYGAGAIAPVSVIAGPGNAYVAEAKRQLFGVVGIDSVAGPSEILVVADNANDPDWIAADLLSQAEHDPSSQSVLITDDEVLADAVERAVQDQLETRPRREIAEPAWRNNSAVFVVADLKQAADIINAIAPEHLELAVEDPEALMADIRHAGAIFLGRYTPEAIGDYVGGPNHVLPTSRAARFASGLSPLDFMKRSSILQCDENTVRVIGPAAARLADAEGLPAHAASIRKRLKDGA